MKRLGERADPLFDSCIALRPAGRQRSGSSAIGSPGPPDSHPRRACPGIERPASSGYMNGRGRSTAHGRSRWVVAGDGCRRIHSLHRSAEACRLPLRRAAFPNSTPQARFCFWLRDERLLDRVWSGVRAADLSWEYKLNNLYVSPVIVE